MVFKRAVAKPQGDWLRPPLSSQAQPRWGAQSRTVFSTLGWGSCRPPGPAPRPMVEVGLVSRCLWETSAGLSRGKVKGEHGHCFRKEEDAGGPASTRACSLARPERRQADGEQGSVHLEVHGWNLWAKVKALSHQDSAAPQTGENQPFPSGLEGHTGLGCPHDTSSLLEPGPARARLS